MPNDGEVRAPKKRSLIWFGDIHELLRERGSSADGVVVPGRVAARQSVHYVPLATVEDVPNRDPYPGKDRAQASSSCAPHTPGIATHMASEYGR
jgi:hypothetical protein